MHIPTPAEIKAKRMHLNLRQSEVADQAGLSQSMVARIESGSVDPRVSTLTRIIEVLNRAERSSITALDIMNSPVLCIEPSDSITKAVRIMEDNNISQIPVLSEGVQVGCISESAIINAFEEGKVSKSHPQIVSDFMEDGFPTVPLSANLDTIVHTLQHHHAILVVEKGIVKGVITKHDLIMHIL